MESSKLDKITSIAEIVGAIAIVISLLFLSFQVRENTIAVRAQTRQALSEQDISYFEAGLDPSIVAGAIAKSQMEDSLSFIEFSQLHRLQNLNFRIFENAYYQMNAGTLEKREWERYKTIIQILICHNENAGQMWASSQVTFSKDFAELVNDIESQCE